MLLDFIEWGGVLGIFLMTLVESTFIPIPSELTLIPAGYLVHQGKFDLFPVYFASVSGSVMGAYLNYWIARHYGRSFLEKHGHYIGLKPEKLHYMDRYFRDHGSVSVFVGRLLPGVKHYISFPAGLASMQLRPFFIQCLLSGALWMALLLAVGYYIGQNEDLIKRYVFIVKGILVILGALVVAWYLYRRHQKKKQLASETLQPVSDE
jgi:membrane protein DedA with SNARE-associated domain